MSSREPVVNKNKFRNDNSIGDLVRIFEEKIKTENLLKENNDILTKKYVACVLIEYIIKDKQTDKALHPRTDKKNLNEPATKFIEGLKNYYNNLIEGNETRDFLYRNHNIITQDPISISAKLESRINPFDRGVITTLYEVLYKSVALEKIGEALESSIHAPSSRQNGKYPKYQEYYDLKRAIASYQNK